jgi:glycerol-3-phosphate responsive antiterminator
MLPKNIEILLKELNVIITYYSLSFDKKKDMMKYCFLHKDLLKGSGKIKEIISDFVTEISFQSYEIRFNIK